MTSEKNTITHLGMGAVTELCAILRAIQKLAESSGDSVIQGIASVGVDLAEKSHNMFDSELDGQA